MTLYAFPGKVDTKLAPGASQSIGGAPALEKPEQDKNPVSEKSTEPTVKTFFPTNTTR